MQNEWLKNKQVKLIGTRDFFPRDYGHLLWYWGIINNIERDYLKGYGKARGLILTCHNQLPIWSHCHKYYTRKTQYFTEDQTNHIELKWKQVSRGLSLNKIGFLDWLTQDAIDFNYTKEQIILRYRSLVKKHGLIDN